MRDKDYHPENYWSEVGDRIESREEGNNVIAGDDEPYYRYKREQFLNLLRGVSFQNKSVLEIGCGPGGNLLEVLKLNPKKLSAVDISSQMVSLATKKVPSNVTITKINGTQLPFDDSTFDIIFTATVLQHNTDESMLKALTQEICRVSSDRVYLFERIESEIKGDELCYGRPVPYYTEIMKNNGYELVSTSFINIRSSYYISGAIRKGLNPKNRKEGESLNGISNALQHLTLPLTSVLDKIFTSKKDIARLEYKKLNS